MAVEETPDGVLITPRAVLAIKALDEMGAILRERGITLEEWMESGRQIRGEHLREHYGIEAPPDPDSALPNPA